MSIQEKTSEVGLIRPQIKLSSNEEELIFDILQQENKDQLEHFIQGRQKIGALEPLGWLVIQDPDSKYQHYPWFVAFLSDRWPEGAGILLDAMVQNTSERIREYHFKDSTLLHWVLGCPPYDEDWSVSNVLAQRLIDLGVDLEAEDPHSEDKLLLAGEWAIRLDNVEGFLMWCSALTDAQMNLHLARINKCIDTDCDSPVLMREVLTRNEEQRLLRSIDEMKGHEVSGPRSLKRL